MSDDREPDKPGRPRLGLVAGFVALVAALIWWTTSRPGDTASSGDDSVSADGTGGDTESNGADPEGAVARVRGQVWLEVPVASGPPEPATPVEPIAATDDATEAGVGEMDAGEMDTGEMDTGEADAGELDAGEMDAGEMDAGEMDAGEMDAGEMDAGEGDAGEGDAGEAEVGGAFEPPEVDLVAPDPGTCRVVAWQEGEHVGETECEDAGSFEVALDAGRFGPTTFEVLVPGRLRAVLQVDVPDGGLGRLPAVALGVAQTVTGQVVDARGEPVVGASVEAMPFPNLEEPEPWRATSDETGVFVLDTVPPGPLSMRVAADGFAPSIVETIAPADDVLVTLGALIDLRGRVVGEAAVLARTRVRLEGSAVWPAIEAEVDPATGAFVFESIADGIYAVEAVAAAEPDDPDAAAEFASFPLENVTPELAVTLALGPAVRAPVLVVDPAGEPVPDARVTLSNATVGLLSRVAATDASGAVAMGPVVPGPYVLRAEADGFLPAEPLAVSLEPAGPDAPPATYTLTLLQPGSLSGAVVDESGRPVAGATVEIEAEHLHTAGEGEARARMFAAALAHVGSLGVTAGPVPPIPLPGAALAAGSDAAVTDAEGAFSITMLAPGTYRVLAHHGRYASSGTAVVTVTAGRVRSGVRLQLRAGYVLTGRVVDGNGRPLRGVDVQADDGTASTSDARGVFALGRRRGRIELVFRRRGYAPRARIVQVRGPTDIEVVLTAADGIVEGRVEGENGEVIADARVTLRLADGLSATRIAWTDARGLYRFEDVPPGAAKLEVDHTDHTTATASLEVADTGTGRPEPTDVALSRGWSLSVHVRAGGDRSAIGGAMVVAGSRSGTTDDAGDVTLDNLTGDAVTVTVSAADYGPWQSTVQAPAAAGPRQAEVSATLSQGGSLRGRVTDYRGDPVSGARITLVGDEDDPQVTHSNVEGRFTFVGLPEGDYEVSATPPSGRSEELAPDAQETDVLRGHVTRGVQLRFDRR